MKTKYLTLAFSFILTLLINLNTSAQSTAQLDMGESYFSCTDTSLKVLSKISIRIWPNDSTNILPFSTVPVTATIELSKTGSIKIEGTAIIQDILINMNMIMLQCKFNSGKLNGVDLVNDSIIRVSLNLKIPLRNGLAELNASTDLIQNEYIIGPNTLKTNQVGTFKLDYLTKGAEYTWSGLSNPTINTISDSSITASWNKEGNQIINVRSKKFVCVNHGQIQVNIEPITGINDLYSNKVFFENPVKTKQLHLSENVEDIKIINLEGVILQTAQNQKIINLSIPKGIYILSLNGFNSKLTIE